jgi:FkbM family methyltransferase
MNKSILIQKIKSRTTKNLFDRVVRFIKYFPKQKEIRSLIKKGKFKNSVTKLITGDSFHIVLPDNISRSTYLAGYFEPEDTIAFIKLIKEGDIFLDIGAHIGYYSILAARLVGNTGAVYSFEPTPSTFKVLKSNTDQFKNASAYSYALFSKQGELEFNDYGVQYMSLNSYKKARIKNMELEAEMITVPTITLDDFIKEYKIKPDLIKIDAESAELEILMGASKSLKSLNPIFFIEVGDFENINIGGSKKIIEVFQKEGYQAYEYVHDKFVLIGEKDDKFPSINLFFSKSKLN